MSLIFSSHKDEGGPFDLQQLLWLAILPPKAKKKQLVEEPICLRQILNPYKCFSFDTEHKGRGWTPHIYLTV